MFCKKDVLENLAKFTGEHLCQGLVFNKVGGKFIKKEARCIPANIFQYTFSYRAPPMAAFVET